jgi:hypothetical protein
MWNPVCGAAPAGQLDPDARRLVEGRQHWPEWTGAGKVEKAIA